MVRQREREKERPSRETQKVFTKRLKVRFTQTKERNNTVQSFDENYCYMQFSFVRSRINEIKQV